MDLQVVFRFPALRHAGRPAGRHAGTHRKPEDQLTGALVRTRQLIVGFLELQHMHTQTRPGLGTRVEKVRHHCNRATV